MDGGDEGSRMFTALEASICDDPAVDFVVAFGSQLTDEATQSSDFDVAIKFADTLSAHERFETLCFLSGDLQRDDAPFIDVSDIETLPIDVAHDAVNGAFVCGDANAFERFANDVETRFVDQRDDLRRQQQDVIDRIAEDGLRG